MAASISPSPFRGRRSVQASLPGVPPVSPPAGPVARYRARRVADARGAGGPLRRRSPPPPPANAGALAGITAVGRVLAGCHAGEVECPPDVCGRLAADLRSVYRAVAALRPVRG